MRDIVQQPVSPPLNLPDLELAHDGPDARVYANERALPRVFLACRVPPFGTDAHYATPRAD